MGIHLEAGSFASYKLLVHSVDLSPVDRGPSHCFESSWLLVFGVLIGVDRFSQDRVRLWMCIVV